MLPESIHLVSASVKNKVVFYFNFSTEKRCAGVCDLEGKILIRLTEVSSVPVEIDVKELARGLYKLCVLDGDKIFETKFRKN